MAVSTTISVEDFERLSPSDDRRLELVNGRIVESSFPPPIHNLVAMHVVRLLGAFVDLHRLGLVLPARTGYILSRQPATVRGPDISFLSARRLASVDLHHNIEGAPDLAVEVLSPSDTIAAMRTKLEQYLAAGATAVWVLHPKAREAQVFEPGPRPRLLIAEDTLACQELLPGFSLRVAELFPAAR